MNPSQPTDLKKRRKTPRKLARTSVSSGSTNVNLRLNAEHLAALERIAECEKLKQPEALRKLIRIADQMLSGDQSPFASRLEHLLLAKVG